MYVMEEWGASSFCGLLLLYRWFQADAKRRADHEKKVAEHRAAAAEKRHQREVEKHEREKQEDEHRHVPYP